MTPAESKALWEKVKANVRALEECPGPHDFIDLTPDKRIGKRFKCSRCGGEVEHLHQVWYARGLADGRKDAGGGP